MKGFIVTFLIALILPSIAYSQDVIGQVKDKKGNNIQFARILNEEGKLITVTDSIGLFRVDLTGKTGFEVSYSGFESQWVSKESIKNGRVKIVLDVQLLELDEVTVTNEKYHSALDVNSVNIIDYRPFGNYILTLKRKKDTYYLGIDSVGTEGVSVPFTIDRPRSLYEDCLGNVHVVCDDYVYQFYFQDTNLIVYEPMSIADFEDQLTPCKGWFAYGLAAESLTYNNKQYDLTFYYRGEDSSKVIYHQVDEVAKRIAEEDSLRLAIQNWYSSNGDSSEYDPITLRRMMRKINNGENPDIALAFTSSQTTLGNPVRWEQLMATYMLHSYPVDVRTVQVGNYLAVVDFFVDSIVVFDQKGEVYSSKGFDSQYDIKDVWQDHGTGELYLYANHGGTNELFHLDIFTGETTYVTNLNMIPLTKTRRINDGWLYFRKLVNGYHKVYRIRLPV